jgi:hypothetical protein
MAARSGLLLMVLCLGLGFGVQAQKSKEHVQQVWTGYFNQARLSDKWGLWLDLHLRSKEDFVSDVSQFIGRLGLMYYLNDQTKITAGYAFVNHFPAENHPDISMPEHRPWQQIQWHSRFSNLRMMQWFRLEERYRRKIKDNDELASGYNFNWRMRYNIFLAFPLSKKKFAKNTLSWVVNNEVMINAGKQIVNNYFDQNRFFTGLVFHINDHDQLQFGYMNVFQQLAAGNKYRNTDAIRVFYFQNLDLRNKAH